MSVVILVTFVLVKYPSHLMGEMESVANSIITDLSDFDKDILMKLNKEKTIKYNKDDADGDKEHYKDLRNMGLVRTRSRRAMRYDDTILLTPLGVLIVKEIIKKEKNYSEKEV